MPRETIVNETPEEDFCLTVGWSREGEWVDVTTFRPDAVIGVLDNGKVKLLEGLDRPGWVVNLDRNNINRLIRVLRRARDQAFGKDE